MAGIHDFGETCSSPISNNDDETGITNSTTTHSNSNNISDSDSSKPNNNTAFIPRRKKSDYGDEDFQNKIEMFQSAPTEDIQKQERQKNDYGVKAAGKYNDAAGKKSVEDDSGRRKLGDVYAGVVSEEKEEEKVGMMQSNDREERKEARGEEGATSGYDDIGPDTPMTNWADKDDPPPPPPLARAPQEHGSGKARQKETSSVSSDDDGEDENNKGDERRERVPLPRQHRLGKVLFSMSSYSERPEPERRPALDRQFSDKLEANLAAKQEIIRAQQSKTDQLPSTDDMTGHGYHAQYAGHSDKDSSAVNPTPAPTQEFINTVVVDDEEGRGGHKQPFQPPLPFSSGLVHPPPPPPPPPQDYTSGQPKESQQFPFRSRIIEEFETKRRGGIEHGSSSGGGDGGGGVLPDPNSAGPGENTRASTPHYAARQQFIQSGPAHHVTHTRTLTPGDQNAVARSTQSLDRKEAMGGRGENSSGGRGSQEAGGLGHSLDRSFYKEKGGPMSFSSIVSERRKLLEENHYDSPRSLINKSSFPHSGSHHDADQRVASHQSSPEVMERADLEHQQRTRGPPAASTKGWGYSGPPSISMGVWGDNPRRGPALRIKEDPEARSRVVSPPPPPSLLPAPHDYHQQRPSSSNSERKPSQTHNPHLTQHHQQNIPQHGGDKNVGIQSHNRSSWQPPSFSAAGGVSLVQHRQTKPDPPAKPIEIRYRDRRDERRLEHMEDPRAAVLAASRPRAGGWRDELTRDIDASRLYTKVDRRRSDEEDRRDKHRREVERSAAAAGGVTKPRSRTEDTEDPRYISHNSLVEKRRSQIEGGGRANHEEDEEEELVQSRPGSRGGRRPLSQADYDRVLDKVPTETRTRSPNEAAPVQWKNSIISAKEQQRPVNSDKEQLRSVNGGKEQQRSVNSGKEQQPVPWDYNSSFKNFRREKEKAVQVSLKSYFLRAFHFLSSIKI